MTSLSIALGLVLLPVVPRGMQMQSPQIDCTWLTVDTTARIATLQLGAGLTAANGGRNFNGFRDGRLTLTVPLNWNVVLQFTNRHASLQHSAEVIDSVKSLVAFPRAATNRPTQGLATGQTEDIRFLANRAGSYVIWCAVPGHASAGMWIRFRVSSSDTRPTLASRSS